MVKRKKLYKCKGCGKSFEDWIIRNRKYCSVRCALINSHSHRKGTGKYRYKQDGYIVTVTRKNNKTVKILEHRLMMENYLGRQLQKHEEVHHKNGIKDDNRIENLEIMISGFHKDKIRCPYCLNRFLIK